MSDRIGVMREGKLIQVAPPREIYEKPATIDVAKFVGAANLLPGRVVSTGVVCSPAKRTNGRRHGHDSPRANSRRYGNPASNY
jgi:ABC-type Fe3+/spermidine/putrescine transport system ATPase subunit